MSDLTKIQANFDCLCGIHNILGFDISDKSAREMSLIKEPDTVLKRRLIKCYWMAILEACAEGQKAIVTDSTPNEGTLCMYVGDNQQGLIIKWEDWRYTKQVEIRMKATYWGSHMVPFDTRIKKSIAKVFVAREPVSAMKFIVNQFFEYMKFQDEAYQTYVRKTKDYRGRLEILSALVGDQNVFGTSVKISWQNGDDFSDCIDICLSTDKFSSRVAEWLFSECSRVKIEHSTGTGKQIQYNGRFYLNNVERFIAFVNIIKTM
ncbi:hypothetical protein BOO92_14035 [Vibrio navarrensis]|uniref:hypothetical protein n=1 Tax=Vibrio TaxID=662 RepID=UPI001865F58D|nr:hypothetical protein [Vibrio navarrensis]MBE3657797.1 hypothetical protein [Vibrio navarrensis]